MQLFKMCNCNWNLWYIYIYFLKVDILMLYYPILYNLCGDCEFWMFYIKSENGKKWDAFSYDAFLFSERENTVQTAKRKKKDMCHSWEYCS